MRRRRRTRILRLGIALVVVCVLALLATGAIALHALDTELERAREGLPSNVLRRAVAPRAGDELTLLVIGVDRTSAGDGVQLIHANGTAPLRVLSIPRDLLLDAHDGGERPATIFHQDGPAALVRSVARTTDTPIHRVLVIRLTAMREAIDAVGPIVVRNPNRLETREIDGRAWTFAKGRVELDGREAEAFVRARHNEADPAESDSDRSRRQQLVLTAMVGAIDPLDVMRHPRSLPRDLLGKAATNLSVGELLQLARAARSGPPVRCQLTGTEQLVRIDDPSLPWPARRDGRFLVPDPDELERTVEAWRDGESARSCRNG